MIMKANKQIGFIYKDEESIDKILKDGEVVFERGFLREKTSTTLPITFGGVGKDLKDYKIYGNTKQQLLPNGYTQVDYIESSGTQYIDTGYYGNLNTEVQIKATNSSSNLDRQLFGDITTSSQAISCNLSLSTRLTSRFGNKSVGLTFGDYVSENEIFTLIENKDGIYINNSQIATFDTTDNFSTPNSLLLLTRNSASGAGTVWNGKLYYTKIYDNNMLVRDFIPCYRNSDNEVGLYDLVNNVFYANQGTGVFTYGSVAPTPDAPIEMVSCGDKTKNLFLASDTPASTYRATYSKINKNSFSLNYNQENSSNSSSHIRIDFDVSQFKPNTQYTISKKHIVSGSNFNNAGAIRSYINGSNGSVITGDSFTFTTPNEITSLGMYFYLGYSNTIQGESTITFYDVQLEEGTTATSYEPYGYKIPVNVRSENLCDGINKKYWLSTTVLSAGMADGNSGLAIELKENTNYTISTQIIQERYRVALINTLPTSGTGIPCYNGVKKDGTKDNITISSSQYKYLILNATDLTKCQIVEGSTAPNKYIPYYNETTNIYLDEPLRKIDEYSDYINFINGKIVRQLGEAVLDGSENWASASASGNYSRFVCNAYNDALIPIDLNTIGNILSDKFIPRTANETANAITGIAIAGSGRFVIYYDLTKDYTTTQFKTWLSSNNITVDYALSTPTEEDIELPNIPTIEGNNTLNIETEITPSQVYIKYKSNA